MTASSLPKKKKQRGLIKLMLVLLGLIYFAFLAYVVSYIWLITQDRFVSVASFKISRQNPSSADMGFATLALPGLSDSGSVDSQIAIGFVNSSDHLMHLEEKYNLSQHYSSPAKDFLFRLDRDALLEERLDFYRKRIFAHYDKETGLTMLTVDTFDPELSKTLAADVLSRTEQFINDINQEVADQQLSFIRGEVKRGEEQVSKISMEILELQNTYNIVSPRDTIEANLKLIQELKVQRIEATTALVTLEASSPGSPRIELLQGKLKSIDEQISIESSKISGPEKDRLNNILAKFKELELKLDFANHLHTGASTLLEKHRVDAMARSRFISVIQHPYLPEKAEYPKRPYATATILAIGLLVFLVLRVFVKSAVEKV